MTHRPRKRFGQHFLTDESIKARLLDAIGAHDNDNIIEIGPGLGALTDLLLEQVQHLHVVEIDRDLIALLKKHYSEKRLSVHESDALKFDFTSIDSSRAWRIVGNLPYNISTPLIFHLFDCIDIIDDMHFMLQKEVVKRLAAKPNESLYGRLSVMAQYYCEVSDLFDVPPEAFDPPPKVDSAIVRMVPHTEREEVDVDVLSKVVFLAFNQRRKTLGNTLKTVISKDELIQLNIPPTARAQELNVEKFVMIAKHISKG